MTSKMNLLAITLSVSLLVCAAARAAEAPAAIASMPEAAVSSAAPASAAAAATAADPGLFSKLQVGMTASEVADALKIGPDDTHTYETGKRFIPFYFGSDAIRLAGLWKGLGCLTFSAGYRFQNHGTEWKDFDGTLIVITPDPSGRCYVL
jgi:hypothetical protein